MADNRESIYDDQVIEAAYLHTRPNCFFIGPFARRVSFASQQHRALDLVRALDAKKKLVDPVTQRAKEVAVIGAGVAGITLAAALRGCGCRVHLFEQHDDPLTIQVDAAHRLLHPTISRWPLEELSLTTSFGVMDWFATTSDRVLETMRQDWIRRLKPAADDEDFRFFSKTPVKGLVSQDDPKVSLQMDLDHGAEAWDVRLKKYDLAFVTTGFGSEQAPDGMTTVSYWKEDQIDKWRRERRPAFVSGCGDGGLIDCLRLIHEDFDRGWLTIRLAQLLTDIQGEPLRAKIRAAEDDALMAAKSIATMRAFDHPTGDDWKAYSDDTKVFGPLTDFYRGLAETLPEEAATLLNVSLEKAGVGVGQLKLISTQAKPFGPYAAPIHKLMVAHAMMKNVVEYKQGKLVDDGAHGTFQLGGARDDIRVSGGEALIIRHGSPANLPWLDEIERHSLRVRQFILADYIDTHGKPQTPMPPGYPDREAQPETYIGSRLDMVRELVQILRPGATVSATADGFHYEPNGDPDADVPPAVSLPVPNEVFSVPLKEGVIVDGPAL